jgi:hypothetical protein
MKENSKSFHLVEVASEHLKELTEKKVVVKRMNPRFVVGY